MSEAEQSGPAPEGAAAPLPERVRARVVALASDALGRMATDDVPTSLARVAAFAPARRAKLAGSQIASVLETDASFRDLVARDVRDRVPDLAATVEDGRRAGRGRPRRRGRGGLPRPPGRVAGRGRPGRRGRRRRLCGTRGLPAARPAAAPGRVGDRGPQGGPRPAPRAAGRGQGGERRAAAQARRRPRPGPGGRDGGGRGRVRGRRPAGRDRAGGRPARGRRAPAAGPGGGGGARAGRRTSDRARRARQRRAARPTAPGHPARHRPGPPPRARPAGRGGVAGRRGGGARRGAGQPRPLRARLARPGRPGDARAAASRCRART